jgi:putative ABC transport system permease protein
MRMLIADIRESTRSLIKAPRFLVVASLTLALGIGVVTSIFSVVNGVLFTPLPYPDPDRLVNVSSSAPGVGYDRFPLSPDLFMFFKKNNSVFDDMALYQGARANLTESGQPEVVEGVLTTHPYFSTLGVRFSLGRAYSADEDKPDAPAVAVISHRLWTRRYGSDQSLGGKSIRIDGRLTQVVGITPAWMDASDSPDVWRPARFDPANPPTGNFGWSAIGRLKPGVRPDQAASQLEPLVQRAMKEYIQSDNYRAFLRDGHYRPLVTSMKDDEVGGVREPLLILLGTVAMVLLVACGNVANLCLIRAEARQREIAVRAALGASRSGLVRKLLVEALLVSALGTTLGVVVAAATVPLLLQLAPGTIPRLEEVHVNATVLAFATGAAVVSALIFGLVPAFRYTRPQMLTMLRHGGRSATDHPSRQRGRQALVIVQTAMALVLLVGSGLLARSFTRLMAADQGFQPDHVLTFRVALTPAAYAKPEEVTTFAQQLVDRLAALPGVEKAGATTDLPVVSSTSGTAFEFDGQPIESGGLPPIVHYISVVPGYCETLRIGLLRGSDLDASDLRLDSRNVLVSKSLAEHYWPGQDAIGKRLRRFRSQDGWQVVKGIVADVRQDGLRRPPRPLVYFPAKVQDGDVPRTFTFVLRGPGAESQTDGARRAVWALNPDLPVASMRTMNDVIETSVTEFTFTMLTLGIAAAIALVLGAIGLYGVQSYAVSLRTREIGVRMALGAQPSRVQRSILANAGLITGIGLVIGAAGAAGLTRLLKGLLYETRALDPATFVAMAGLLLAVALFASYLPARRAASVSPIEAMRGE